MLCIIRRRVIFTIVINFQTNYNRATDAIIFLDRNFLMNWIGLKNKMLNEAQFSWACSSRFDKEFTVFVRPRRASSPHDLSARWLSANVREEVL